MANNIFEQKHPIIAVDFDDTIAANDRFPDIGEELPGAVSSLKELQSVGCKIIIWTCRNNEGEQAAVSWLKERDFVADAVNAHIPNVLPNQENIQKVFANLYLDDKSFPPFPGWHKFMQWFRQNWISFRK